MTPQALSVCMPTFNGERYLLEQLESIFPLLSPADEVIIVDDCSTDRTMAILSDFAQREKRLSLVRNDANIGVVKTVEKALLLARHETIFLADQDDIWLPAKISRAVARLAPADVVCVLSNNEIFVDDNRTGRLFFPAGSRPRMSMAAQLYRNDFIGCCMCFKRSVLATALPFPDGVSMHDWWLGVNALAQGKVQFDDEPTILYRRHASNATQSTRRNMLAVVQSRFHNVIAVAILLARRLVR